jgi:hypothetical protein
MRKLHERTTIYEYAGCIQSSNSRNPRRPPTVLIHRCRGCNVQFFFFVIFQKLTKCDQDEYISSRSPLPGTKMTAVPRCVDCHPSHAATTTPHPRGTPPSSPTHPRQSACTRSHWRDTEKMTAFWPNMDTVGATTPRNIARRPSVRNRCARDRAGGGGWYNSNGWLVQQWGLVRQWLRGSGSGCVQRAERINAVILIGGDGDIGEIAKSQPRGRFDRRRVAVVMCQRGGGGGVAVGCGG